MNCHVSQTLKYRATHVTWPDMMRIPLVTPFQVPCSARTHMYTYIYIYITYVRNHISINISICQSITILIHQYISTPRCQYVSIAIHQCINTSVSIPTSISLSFTAGSVSSYKPLEPRQGERSSNKAQYPLIVPNRPYWVALASLH